MPFLLSKNTKAAADQFYKLEMDDNLTRIRIKFILLFGEVGAMGFFFQSFPDGANRQPGLWNMVYLNLETKELAGLLN